MAQPKHAMEIFEVLDKSNCRDCGEKTCLAFASAVFNGLKKIDECPKLDQETIERFSADSGGGAPNAVEENRDAYLNELKRRVADIDLAEAARRTGGEFDGNKLTLKILGRNFSVDVNGKLYADIHINPWVASPFLNYVLYTKGLPVSGDWRSFRELKEGAERYPLFQKRCEEPMKRLADVYTDLFDDMVRLFNGKQVDQQFQSDISVALHPLPRVPIMVCYWLPDEGLDSSLNLFFDRTADENLDIGSVFSLGAGLAQMFEKIAVRHGVSREALGG